MKNLLKNKQLTWAIIILIMCVGGYFLYKELDKLDSKSRAKQLVQKIDL